MSNVSPSFKGRMKSAKPKNEEKQSPKYFFVKPKDNVRICPTSKCAARRVLRIWLYSLASETSLKNTSSKGLHGFSRHTSWV